jgi:hypothetical protein
MFLSLANEERHCHSAVRYHCLDGHKQLMAAGTFHKVLSRTE